MKPTPKLIPGCRDLIDREIQTQHTEKLKTTIALVAKGYVALHRPDLSGNAASDLATRAATIAWQGILDGRIQSRKGVVTCIWSMVCPHIVTAQQ